jgi:hypothetical protein
VRALHSQDIATAEAQREPKIGADFPAYEKVFLSGSEVHCSGSRFRAQLNMADQNKANRLWKLLEARDALVSESAGCVAALDALAKEATTPDVAAEIIDLVARMQRVHDTLKALDLGQFGTA